MTNRRTFILSGAALTSAVIAGPLLAAGHGRIGTFHGQSGHKAQGRVEIVTHGGKTTLDLLDDFVFDGAPDSKLAFGNNGFDQSTVFTKLNSNSGKQIYEVPAGIDASAMNEVWIWCEQYSVPLGVAKLDH